MPQPSPPDAREIRRSCLALRVRLENRLITKLYDDALRPHGLRVTQLALLAFTEEQGALRQADLCFELQLDDSTLSRNLERMRNNGWLEAVEGEDAREHPHRLTPEGRALLARALPAWQAAQEAASELLGSKGVQALRAFASRQGLSS